MLKKRRFQLILLLLGLWVCVELVCRLGAEILWFEEVDYLSVYLTRLITKSAIWATVFCVTASYLLVNLSFAQRYSHNDISI